MALRESLGMPREPQKEATQDGDGAGEERLPTKEELGPARKRGAAMSLQEAVMYALEESP